MATLLLVGLTVVLAATAYAWTSGYANVPSSTVKSLALVSNGPAEDGVKSYTVAAAMPGLSYSDLALSLDGIEQPLVTSMTCAAPAPGRWAACEGDRGLLARDRVMAGDTILLRAEAGQRLRIVDPAAGAVLFGVLVD